MRHSRRAVMAERYTLYMKKHIFNGKYFVRNLQIGLCTLAITAVAVGGAVLVNADGNKESVSNVNVSVKDALFGDVEEPENVLENTEAGTIVDDVMTAAPATEVVFVEMKSLSECVDEYVASEPEQTEAEPEKSEFDGKCIANVEETLNVRKDPSTDGEFVGSMNSGAIAIVEGTEGEWTKIKSGDVVGYVLSDYVLTGESAEQFAKDYVTLLGTALEDGVNVRTEESTDADILTVLEKDDTFTVLEDPSDKEDSEEEGTEEAAEDDIVWVPVMLKNGQTGYVSAEFVDIDRLYAIAVSAEELQRQAAEKAAAEEAARLAEASKNTSKGGSSNNSSSYRGASTTPVSAVASGECIGTFTITAYCGCSQCCGGHGATTASGTIPTEGRTIAADTSILPFGTQVVIDGIVYTVEDRGSGVVGNHIDIFFATHESALAYGTRVIKVYKY